MEILNKEIEDFVNALSEDIFGNKFNTLNRKHLYTLFISLILRKRYTNSANESKVFDRCLSYFKDVVNMNRMK